MKIKNKKLLTRLFALLASLVLVLALALPCFADQTEPPPTDYIYKRVYSFDDILPLFSGDGIIRSLPAIYYDYEETSKFVYGTVALYGDDLITFSAYGSQATGNFYIYGELEPTSTSFAYIFDSYAFDFTHTSYSYDVPLVDAGLYVFAPLSSADDGTIVEEQGWYGQIKNIIKDAVFGSDTVLNDSQEFTLNQIALWLSLIVILLPFVIVAVIVVRCFR